MPPKCFETAATWTTVPCIAGGTRNAGSGKPSYILRLVMAASSSGTTRHCRLSLAQIPTRPPGEYITKPTKISPNQSSQSDDQIENNSRKRMKKITTIASSSPENGTETASAETR